MTLTEESGMFASKMGKYIYCFRSRICPYTDQKTTTVAILFLKLYRLSPVLYSVWNSSSLISKGLWNQETIWRHRISIHTILKLEYLAESCQAYVYCSQLSAGQLSVTFHNHGKKSTNTQLFCCHLYKQFHFWHIYCYTDSVESLQKCKIHRCVNHFHAKFVK